MSDEHIPSQIARGVLQLGAFARSRQWRDGETLDLTPTQLAIVRLLRDRGPSRATMLARQLGVTQPTVSDALAALRGKGLIERAPDPDDGRARQVLLTADGNRLGAARHDMPRDLVAAFGSLGPAEQAGVLRGLTMAIRYLQDVGAIEPQRTCVSCLYFRPHAHDDAARPHHCAFVDAAFGDADLRLDCADHEEADPAVQTRAWSRFMEDQSA